MKDSVVRLAWFVGIRFGTGAKGSQMMSFISSVSVAGLVMGVALLVLVVAVMNGFDRELRTNILSVVPQVSIYHRQGIDDWQATINTLKQIPVANSAPAMAPFVQLEGLINRGGNVEPVLVYGVDAVLEKHVSTIAHHIDDGLLERLASEPETLLLGGGLAEKLGLTVGDSVSLVVPKPNRSGRAAGVKVLRLIGLINTGTELDQGMGLMALESASELAATPGTVSGIRLRLNDLFDAPFVASRIVNALPYGHYVSNWTRTHGNLYHAVQTSSSLVWLLLVLIIGIAVFNVVSTLVLSVVEKQANIAILRTLGASPGEILSIFMVQGLMIGLIGTGLGLLIGLLLTQVAGSAVEAIEFIVGAELLTSDIYPVSYLPIDVRAGDTLAIAVTAVILSLLASLYPAWRASRVQPADALRYD